MAIPMLATTRAVLGERGQHCDSRSLFASRYADPQSEKDARRRWFDALARKKAENSPASTSWLPTGVTLLHARLKSRLLIDLAGGVMENANISVDRYGYPRISGSAAKGCARRTVLHALRDWIAELDGQSTSSDSEDIDEGDYEDACAPCREGFATPAEMLAAAAVVFGWVEKDWQSGKKKGLFQSDFGWACYGDLAIWGDACRLLGDHLCQTLPDEEPWNALPDFAGTVAFLPARPNRDPGIEIDVLTPHHKKYHEGVEGFEEAPDSEDPVPVNFPAFAAQSEDGWFTFPLVPLARARDRDLDLAHRWLATGLEVFGVGAKGAAGYGWFDASEEVNAGVRRLEREASVVSEFRRRFSDFSDWGTEKKEEAVLELSDRTEDCAVWQRLDPVSFVSVQQYATVLGIELSCP